ncbi:Anamorsin [Galdieria sulphuraria]|nr:Anamorsin [Galdieria sulphuraria]
MALLFQAPKDLEDFLSRECQEESNWKLSFKFNPSSEQWNAILEKVFGYLSKDGTLELELSGIENTSPVKTELKLCGFKDIEEDYSQEAKKSNGELEEVKHGATQKETVQLWKKLSAAQVDEQDLVDENSLVEMDETLEGVGQKSACAVGRKPCANCTCGKAEKLENSVKIATYSLTETAPSSACGNCYRGDAFRCAGCPYLGLPPFKPGEKVALSSQLQADI